METSASEKLFDLFSPIDPAQWMDKVEQDLKGKPFDKLVWKNINGLDIKPFYVPQDQTPLLENTGSISPEPLNLRRIERTETAKNDKILKAKEEGVNALTIEFDGEEHISALLQGLDLNSTFVAFKVMDQSQAFIEQAVQFFKEKVELNPALNGLIEWPILEQLTSTKSQDQTALENISNAMKAFEAYPNFKCLGLDASLFQNQGSNQVQEMAFALSAFVEISEELIQKGHQAQEIWNNSAFRLGISSAYFVEISKFRAFRALCHSVAAQLDAKADQLMLIGRSSTWSKGATDQHSNLLRLTTEAMSALLGNANGVEIDPFDYGLKSSNDFSARISSNIFHLLTEEAYLTKSSNPVDGAYYLEQITAQLAEKALLIFKETQAKGGFLAGLQEGWMTEQIDTTRQLQTKAFGQRRQVQVGVNKYPNGMEEIDAQILTKATKGDRLGLEFEALRLQTEELTRETGRRPLVERLTYGNLTMRKARSGFAADLLGVAGFDIGEEQFFSDPITGIQSLAKSPGQIVVLCASDEDHQKYGLEMVESFRALNEDKVLLLAGNLKNEEAALREAGLDDAIHLRAELLPIFHRIHQKLLSTSKALRS